FHDVEQGAGDAGTGAAQGVAQGDGAAIEVDLLFDFVEQLQVLQYRQGLRGEGFVEFDVVDVVDGQAGAGQGCLRGRYRAVAHDGGVAAGHGHAADLGARFQAHGLGLFGAHHQHGGGAVGQRRGGAGGDGAADRVEYRAQFGHVLDAGVGTDHFVDFA